MADKSIIGASLGTTTFPVERGKVREFARAILDEAPEYMSDKPVAPPTFTMTTAFWDRVPSGPTPDPGFKDYRRVLHGEQQFEYLRPVNAGDMLTGETKIADVYTKEGSKGGTLYFVVFETVWKNQDGEDAVISRNVIVETQKAAV